MQLVCMHTARHNLPFNSCPKSAYFENCLEVSETLPLSFEQLTSACFVYFMPHGVRGMVEHCLQLKAVLSSVFF